MTDELLEVVDDADRVVGYALRQEIHEKGLLHRSAHVFLFRHTGELALQLRSASKDLQPGLYDSSAAGHVAIGEDYRACASRELREELGLEAPVDEVASFTACPETGWEHVRLYEACAPEEPNPNPEEVDAILWLEPAAIEAMIRAEPHRFTSDFRYLFPRYRTLQRKRPPSAAASGPGAAGAFFLLLLVALGWMGLSARMGLPQSSDLSVYIIPIEGVIDLGLAPFVERTVKEANDRQVPALVLLVNTFGGRVDAAVRIRDALLDSEVLSIAFVDKRAISAGALISLAAHKIEMAPGSTIGAAEPVQMGPGGESAPAGEKAISYMRKEMKATAERRGRPTELAEAMVDPDVEVEGVDEKGKLLTLTTEEAVRLRLADGTSASLQEVLTKYGLEGHGTLELSPNWAEAVARALTHPMVSSVLITIGILGLLLEFATPGWGVAGTVGIAALVLFFWGNSVVHLAGWEEVLLFAVGVLLVLLEVFIIPGFGVAGVAGIAAIIVALTLSLVGQKPTIPDLSSAVLRVAVSMIIAFGVFFGTLRLIPRTSFGRRLVLQASVGSAAGYVAAEDQSAQLVGAEGDALTDLHPSGKALLGGRRVNVVSEGDYIPKGTRVRVVAVQGSRVVVKRVPSEGQVPC